MRDEDIETTQDDELIDLGTASVETKGLPLGTVWDGGFGVWFG